MGHADLEGASEYSQADERVDTVTLPSSLEARFAVLTDPYGQLAELEEAVTAAAERKESPARDMPVASDEAGDDNDSSRS